MLCVCVCGVKNKKEPSGSLSKLAMEYIGNTSLWSILGIGEPQCKLHKTTGYKDVPFCPR